MITKTDDPVMVLMLTASGARGDRVSGFALGADDYLAKPFHFPELVLRLHALARRAPAPEPRIQCPRPHPRAPAPHDGKPRYPRPDERDTPDEIWVEGQEAQEAAHVPEEHGPLCRDPTAMALSSVESSGSSPPRGGSSSAPKRSKTVSNLRTLSSTQASLTLPRRTASARGGPKLRPARTSRCQDRTEPPRPSRPEPTSRS